MKIQIYLVVVRAILLKEADSMCIVAEHLRGTRVLEYRFLRQSWPQFGAPKIHTLTPLG